MREAIDAVLDAGGGTAARSTLLAVVPRAGLDDEIRRGLLTAVFPRAYARPWRADEPDLQLRAALASVGGQVALSHLTALGQRGLPVPDDAPLHVTAYQPRHPRGVPDELIVHRTLRPLAAGLISDLPTVPLDEALVSSWPLLAGPAQRAPIIAATQRGLIRGNGLITKAEQMWWIADLAALRALVAKIVAGCESELELWGYDSVFDVPGLDDGTRQKRIRIGSQTYRLDLAFEDERLAVELDGRAYHASPAQWERDIARDLALATIGWQTIRLSHARLTNDVYGCRRDVLAVRAARRQLRAG